MYKHKTRQNAASLFLSGGDIRVRPPPQAHICILHYPAQHQLGRALQTKPYAQAQTAPPSRHAKPSCFLLGGPPSSVLICEQKQDSLAAAAKQGEWDVYFEVYLMVLL